MNVNLSIQTGDDVVVLEDPFNPGETYTRPRVQLVDVDLLNMVAEFPRVKDAQEFITRYLSSGGSWEANVRLETSRRVRWTAAVVYDPPVSSKALYVEGILENAGYVGGTRARVGFASVALDHAEPQPTLRALSSY